MIATATTTHVPAFRRREEERKHAVLNPSPETLRRRLANCEEMLRTKKFGIHRQVDVEDQVKRLKAQLGDE